MHESPSNQPNISLREATDSMKEAIKDTIQNPGAAWQKVVADVNISESGITLINNDNTKRYFAFANIVDPKVEVYNDPIHHNIIFVALVPPWESVVFSNDKSAKMFADALFYLKHIDINKVAGMEREDCLRQARQTPIDLILAGATSWDLNLPSIQDREPIEKTFNDVLIEWKTKSLWARLQESSSSQLSDLVIKLEKAMLNLDLQAGKLKDAADADARQVTPPGGTPAAKKAPENALATARLLEQRKAILIAILNSVKQAKVQRAASGG